MLSILTTATMSGTQLHSGMTVNTEPLSSGATVSGTVFYSFSYEDNLVVRSPHHHSGTVLNGYSL